MAWKRLYPYFSFPSSFHQLSLAVGRWVYRKGDRAKLEKSITVRLCNAEHFKLSKKPLSQVPSAEALGGVFVIEEEVAECRAPFMCLCGESCYP